MIWFTPCLVGIAGLLAVFLAAKLVTSGAPTKHIYAPLVIVFIFMVALLAVYAIAP